MCETFYYLLFYCEAKEIVVENTLDEFQKLVGGDIEMVYFGFDNLRIVCNEVGLIKHLPVNMRLVHALKDKKMLPTYDVLCGDIFFAAFDKEGNFRSMTDREIFICLQFIECGVRTLHDW